MVTASHNPPRGQRLQGLPRRRLADRAAGRRRHRRPDRRASPAVADVPRADDGWETLGDDVLEAYLDDVVTVVAADTPARASPWSTRRCTASAPRPSRQAFVRAGFDAPMPVAEPGRARPDVPDRALPQPRGAGRDGRRPRARRADRAGPRHRQRPRRRPVRRRRARPRRLADAARRRGRRPARRAPPRPRASDEDAVLANSIVSSRLLGRDGRKAAGVRHEETLTGFKWISRVEGLRYGYEEALGYCVDPAHVRDKDGDQRGAGRRRARRDAQGRGPVADRPARRPRRGARRARHRRAVGAGGRPVADRATSWPGCARSPPTRGGRHGGHRDRRPAPRVGDALPPTDGLRYLLDDGSRIIVRPSGTEPKLKVYLEVVEPVAKRKKLDNARAAAADRLAALRSAMAELTTV